MEEGSPRGSEVLLPPLLGLDGVEDGLALGLVLLANLLDLLLHHGVQGREPLLELIHAPSLQLAGRQERNRDWHQCKHHLPTCRDPAAPPAATEIFQQGKTPRALLQAAALSEGGVSPRILLLLISQVHYMLWLLAV